MLRYAAQHIAADKLLMCFCVFLLLQGLNVSLSTDDPLMLHYTNDALLEEYSVAAQVQPTKLCRISQLLLR